MSHTAAVYPARVLVAAGRASARHRTDDGELIAVARTREALESVADVSGAMVDENHEAIAQGIRHALSDGCRLVIVYGASGVGVGNDAPEAVRECCAVELPGIAEALRAYGLNNTPTAALSRSVVGVTGKGPGHAILVSAPGSRGAIDDTLTVLVPLLPSLFRQLDERR